MQKNVIRVLISSPSDVQAEGELAEQVIAEVNAMRGPDSSVMLQSVRAQRDVPPGLAGDPQDVINRALPDFEIFVGIMWTRIGTPTPRAASGTVEEFETAISRSTNPVRFAEVMFFFSKKTPDLDDIDTDQLSRLRAFKGSLSSRGVYYKEYRDLDQFRSLLTIALARAADKA